MRIAIANDSVDTDGGVETYLLSIVRELERRGHAIVLVHVQSGASRSAIRASVDEEIAIGERGLERAMDDLRAWAPNVCYSHNMRPLDVDRAMLARWPVVKMLHGFFGTCVSGLKMHAWPSPVACHRTFGPACLALYVPRRCGQLSPAKMIDGYRWSSDQRRLFDRYKSVVVASDFMQSEISRNGLSADRIDVLPLFSTMDVPATVAPAERDTVLFAGRMTTLKGGQVLIPGVARASAILGRPVRLVMAGDGPQMGEWKTLADSMGVPVEMTGWLAAEQRASTYARGSLVAVPSLWPEPFGLVGLDAASLGRPAVAFDVGGVRQWLADGVSGRLVDPAAGAQGLGDAIAALIGRPDDCARMGHAALDVSQRMTVRAHVDGLEGVLDRAVS